MGVSREEDGESELFERIRIGDKVGMKESSVVGIGVSVKSGELGAPVESGIAGAVKSGDRSTGSLSEPFLF